MDAITGWRCACGAPINADQVTCGKPECIEERRRYRDRKRTDRLAERQKYEGYMRIPSLIQAARKSKGYSRDKLADILGYDSKARHMIIYNWERGERPIPPLKLESLAAALGLNADDIRQQPLSPGDNPQQRLMNARIIQGLTQRQVGERLGFDSKSGAVMVGRWENGERPIPQAYIRQLADLLGLKPDDLLP